MSTPTIVELIDVCERMAATSRRLFWLVGAWVADEPDPSAQRWFSTGAHRHAWHAELWEARRPAVPVESAAVATPDIDADIDDRVPWYRSQLGQLLADLDELGTEIDPELDPSTARTVALVRSDIVDLIDMIDMIDRHTD